MPGPPIAGGVMLPAPRSGRRKPQCAAIPTIGLFRCMAPADPKNGASPKEKIPPSDAASQYPFPVGVAAIPTIGLLSRTDPADPKNGASPKEKIPPSDAASQYPLPVGAEAIPTIGFLSRGPPAD